MYQLWFGPRVTFEVDQVLSLFVTPKISVNYVDLDVSRSGGFAATGYDTSGHDSEVLFGAGIIGGIELAPCERFFVTAWGGYEWVHDSVDANIEVTTV